MLNLRELIVLLKRILPILSLIVWPLETSERAAWTVGKKTGLYYSETFMALKMIMRLYQWKRTETVYDLVVFFRRKADLVEENVGSIALTAWKPCLETGGMMKSFFRAINDTSCQNRRRRKQNITKSYSDLNTTMGACLDLHSEAPIKILLVPCESQPPSSTRYWIVDKRRSKLPFFGSSMCEIVQHMGNKVSEPFQGRVLSREGRTIIKGILTDGAAEGRYFELVLFASSQELDGKIKTCGNSTSLCGFLQRSASEKSGQFEETHDAFLHTATDNYDEVYLTRQENTKTAGQKKPS